MRRSRSSNALIPIWRVVFEDEDENEDEDEDGIARRLTAAIA
jgi:hypothetical protein